jgi:hypothetical protein
VLWNGPEDWRLAYLSFGVLALGALTVVVFPLALLVSYVLSRAGLAVAKEKGVELGTGRKWLLYPPVVLVSAALFVAVVAWPAALGGVTAEQVAGAANRVRDYDRPERIALTPREFRDVQASGERKERMAAQVADDRALLAAIPVSPGWAPAVAGLFVGFGAVVLWWTVIGFVGAAFPGAVRAAFVPLCERFERRHGSWLGWVCLALAVGWCVAAWDIARAAGWI